WNVGKQIVLLVVCLPSAARALREHNCPCSLSLGGNSRWRSPPSSLLGCIRTKSLRFPPSVSAVMLLSNAASAAVAKEEESDLTCIRGGMC
uniref:Secreted protein n=1 Tax=Astyanax mexicanus TaxID=7994 RepID=A0A3B1K0K9_ASTMX